jgi:hypothetical protein
MQPRINQGRERVQQAAVQPEAPGRRFFKGIGELLVRMACTTYASNKFVGLVVRSKIANCAGFVFDKFHYLRNNGDLSQFTNQLPYEQWFPGHLTRLGTPQKCLIACKTAMDIGSDTLSKIPINCDVTKRRRFDLLTADNCFQACGDDSLILTGLMVVNAVDIIAERIIREPTLPKNLLKLGISAVTGVCILSNVARLSAGDAFAAWALNRIIFDLLRGGYHVLRAN